MGMSQLKNHNTNDSDAIGRKLREMAPPHTLEALDEEDGSSETNSNNDTSSGSWKESSDGTGRRRESNVAPVIAQRENKLVTYSRMLVMLVLFVSTGLVAYFTWDFVTDEEQDDFKAQFRNDAKELIDISDQNANNIFGVLTIFSTLIPSAADQANATFPLFTLSDFEHFGSQARELSGALLLAYTPLVPEEYREAWEVYALQNQEWIAHGLDVLGTDYYEPGVDRPPRDVSPFIYRKTTRSYIPERVGLGQYSPCWQMSPAPKETSVVNFNLFNEPTFNRLVKFAIQTRQAAISEVIDTELLFGNSAPQKGEDPQSILVLPVFEITGDITSRIVGHVIAVIPWGLFFDDVLQDGHDGVYAVLRESCGSNFTYSIDGKNATFLGVGDLHEPEYDDMVRSTRFVAYDGNLNDIDPELAEAHCEYTLDVYPSAEYEEQFESSRPIIFTVGVILVFAFTSCVFTVYDCMVGRRQRKVNSVAVKSSAIVTSLFPAQVRDKLYQDEEEAEKKKKAAAAASSANPFKRSNANANAFMNTNHPNFGGPSSPGGGGADGTFGPEQFIQMQDDDDDDMLPNRNESAPIADLFPSATVLFMDIAGFTAWSSTREPTQVFTLLETIYRSFDKIAKHRRVFKVETIGDCYVAVCGLPEPNEDHAIVMARFARDCLSKMDELTRKLEVRLGPDTGDLAMRVGLHSGPVTAGVLRGDRARFQLFGDTVNTAARMESTGIKKRIQVSQETAELIIAAGKSQWIRAREEAVVAKGKGELHTYWLLPKYESVASTHTPSESGDSESGSQMDAVDTWMKAANQEGTEGAPETVEVYNDKIQRLVEYNVDILLQTLKKIIARREAAKGAKGATNKAITELEDDLGHVGPCLEEVVEVIELPKFDSAAYTVDASNVEVSQAVITELNNYVEIVASMYRDNAFHNFEHASHVTQSTTKLLSRIVALKHIENGEELHDHTYGITSDPLTQFACILSSLVHDVDHRGVPNGQLIKEDPALGAMYQEKAVAEQNSIDVAWNLLMDPQYENLRGAIYANDEEMKRFRQLLVNSILATDIFDKELGAIRKNRWQKAFSPEAEEESDARKAVNRKATIVIEHIIQASDVAHTMQHWHIYVKWNQMLFDEMHRAFVDGRSNKDPTEGWYEGELWFFDNYVIPLANKLKECGVFGVSGDEYLNYAQANRREWARKGKKIVLDKYKKGKRDLE